MGESKKPIEKRVEEKEAQLRIAMEKVAQYKEQLRQLQNRKNSEDRKRRNHMLIIAGAELASIFGHTLNEDEVARVAKFLRQQVDSSRFSLERTPDISQQERQMADFDFFFNGQHGPD